jgi:hypothetical protein
MHIRTVVEERSVTEKIYSESNFYPRLEEAYDALTWWLARNAEHGELIDDYYWIYKQRGNRDLKIPALVALYTVDHHDITIHSLLLKLPTL